METTPSHPPGPGYSTKAAGGRAELPEPPGPEHQGEMPPAPPAPNADDSDTDEGLGGLGKSKSRAANKTRRARRKAFRPYYQLSEGERDVREERERLRVAKLKERMWAKGRIIAPYNTTQFLMADTEQPHAGAEDGCYYAATPAADDQDFMCQEFRKEYEVHNINRLDKMSKEMLLSEYMLLERKNEKLEEKLKTIKEREEAQEEEATNGRNNSELEYANRLMKLQSEMEKLKMENQRLLAENVEMRRRLNNESESEESSDTESSSSSSSEADFSSLLEDKQMPGYREQQSSDDPGYESNQSKGEIK